MSEKLRGLLEKVKNGEVSVDEALLDIKKAPFEDIDYAKVDLHRRLRQGAAEVIYGAGKTPEQIIGIAEVMLKNGQQTILITRLSAAAADVIAKVHPLRYHVHYDLPELYRKISGMHAEEPGDEQAAV